MMGTWAEEWYIIAGYRFGCRLALNYLLSFVPPSNPVDRWTREWLRVFWDPNKISNLAALLSWISQSKSAHRVVTIEWSWPTNGHGPWSGKWESYAPLDVKEGIGSFIDYTPGVPLEWERGCSKRRIMHIVCILPRVCGLRIEEKNCNLYLPVHGLLGWKSKEASSNCSLLIMRRE